MSDYTDAYIVAKGRISVTSTNDAKRRNESLTLNYNYSFRSCITKITFIDNPEYLDIVM